MKDLEFKAEPGKNETTITVVYDAPRDKVFRMYEDPDLIPKYWGPGTLDTVVDKMEVKPGGIWRFVQRDGQGNEYAFHGVYHDVAEPERMIYTFEFEAQPGHVMLESAYFEELDGMTKVTATDVFQSVEDRDAAIASGMEAGARESMERFGELVESS